MAEDCQVCGARPHGIELKVLPASSGQSVGSATVKLVRQLKMPTVDHLVSDPCVEKLPEAMEEVEQAVEEGDLASADRLLDSALGAVLAGPGHDKRASGWSFVTLGLPLVLWLWCGILVVLLVLSFLG